MPPLQALQGVQASLPVSATPTARTTASPAPAVSHPHGMGFALQLASMLDEQTAELGLLHTFSLPADGSENGNGHTTAVRSRTRRRRDPDDSDEEDLQADDDVILTDQSHSASSSQAARASATSHYRACESRAAFSLLHATLLTYVSLCLTFHCLSPLHR